MVLFKIKTKTRLIKVKQKQDTIRNNRIGKSSTRLIRQGVSTKIRPPFFCHFIRDFHFSEENHYFLGFFDSYCFCLFLSEILFKNK